MAYYNPVTTIASVGSQALPVPVTIASTTEPTKRENGGDLRQGDQWFNTSNGQDHLYVEGVWRLVGKGNETNYTLPVATSTVLGGIKIGTGLQINPNTGLVTTSSAPYLAPGANLWGRYFNGTASIQGNLDNVGVITGTTNLILKAGDNSAVFFRATSTGNQYMFNNAAGTFQGNLKFEALTASRNYTFPDKGGTIAMTSDITITLDTLKSVVAASSDFADFQARIAAL